MNGAKKRALIRSLASWGTAVLCPYNGIKGITKALQRWDAGVTFLRFGGNHL
jgi:hypothetical protein